MRRQPPICKAYEQMALSRYRVHVAATNSPVPVATILRIKSGSIELVAELMWCASLLNEVSDRIL